MQPNTLSYDHGRLFVALAGVNGVAVFRVEQEKDLEIAFEGVLPVGAYPAALLYTAHIKTLFIANGRRSYDQVLGDMPEGNGSPELTLFGERVTPNHHALAREYILFDNFYVNGDVSADGHFWSTAGTSTEYVDKMWPHEYSQRLPGILDAPYDGDADHDQPVAAPQSGFLWDRLLKAGISFRNYGEWYAHEQQDPKKVHVYLAGLKNHSNMNFRDDLGDVTDQQRVNEWEREFTEFEKNGQLPRFSLIYVPATTRWGPSPAFKRQQPWLRTMIWRWDASSSASRRAAIGRRAPFSCWRMTPSTGLNMWTRIARPCWSFRPIRSGTRFRVNRTRQCRW